jgi:hypothetical protein
MSVDHNCTTRIRGIFPAFSCSTTCPVKGNYWPPPLLETQHDAFSAPYASFGFSFLWWSWDRLFITFGSPYIRTSRTWMPRSLELFVNATVISFIVEILSVAGTHQTCFRVNRVLRRGYVVPADISHQPRLITFRHPKCDNCVFMNQAQEYSWYLCYVDSFSSRPASQHEMSFSGLANLPYLHRVPELSNASP